MSTRTFSGDQKKKLTQLINEGIAIKTEIETLNAGLSDTIKAVAEEMEIKPSLLKKAIMLAQKSKFTDHQKDQELIQTILETVGRTI